MTRYQNKLLFVLNSMREYLLDILFLRTDPIAFKTAEFFKRNYNRVKHTLLHILYELRHTVASLKKFKQDVKFVFGF